MSLLASHSRLIEKGTNLFERRWISASAGFGRAKHLGPGARCRLINHANIRSMNYLEEVGAIMT